MVSYLSTFPGLTLSHTRTSVPQLRVLPETLHQLSNNELGLTTSKHTANLALKLHSTSLPILTLHFTACQINENLLSIHCVYRYIYAPKRR